MLKAHHATPSLLPLDFVVVIIILSGTIFTMSLKQSSYAIPLAFKGASFSFCMVSLAVYKACPEHHHMSLWCHATKEILLMNSKKRCRQKNENSDVSSKWHFIYSDREQAKHSIEDDYFAQYTRFDDRQFKGMFRNSWEFFDNLRNILCQNDKSFRDSYDASHWHSIVDIKILM